MANITPTVDRISPFGDEAHVITWPLLTAANAAGVAIEMPGSFYRSVQFDGTWDSATAVLQGSNDGTTWFTLNDLQGSAISKTGNALEGIAELTRYVRPSTSGGGGSQSLYCRILLKKVR